MFQIIEVTGTAKKIVVTGLTGDQAIEIRQQYRMDRAVGSSTFYTITQV